jgi:hypothetical protein
MNAVKATWKNGHIVPDAPVQWHEGCRLVIREEQLADVEFMTEEQQSADPVSVQKWIEDFRSIPPLSMTPEQEAEFVGWRQKAKEFNIEAVRRQMEEGIS